jgi:hypothetical protein
MYLGGMLEKERSYDAGIVNSKDHFGTALIQLQEASANNLSELMECNLLSNLQHHFNERRTRATLLFSITEGKFTELVVE